MPDRQPGPREGEGFLPEIAVLRGVSILLVLLYHLQAPPFVSGYLGVDVFFVISGYLMALLYADLPDRAAVLGYYRKRLDRVLPAYFAVLIATVAAAALLVLPHELADVLRHAAWSAAAMPNVGFWMDETYFDKGVFKPFLHFWSLGVEVQFYLIFPAIAFLHRRSRLAVPLILLGSLAACLAMTELSPKTAFFMMPLRIWEFLLGFLACTLGRTLAPSRGGQAIGLGGLALLVALSCMPWDVEQHPGVVALAACIATVAVATCGLPHLLREGALGRGLQTLGKYSYSLYLTHFPVIAIYHYEPFAGLQLGPNPPLLAIGLAMLAGALAVANFHLVEHRFRHGRSGRRSLAAYCGLAAIIVAVSPALAAIHRAGFAPAELRILDAWADRGTYRCGKLRRLLEPFGRSCHIAGTGGDRSRRFLLVGNSHADALKDAMGTVAAQRGASLRLMKQNCPLGEGDCRPELVVAEARRENVGTVILHASGNDVSPAATAELLGLAEANDLQVVFIDPVPAPGFDTPKELYRYGYPAIWAHRPVQTAADYAAARADLLRAMHFDSPRYTRYPVLPYFCDPQCRIVSEDGRPLYFDSHHVTLTGAHRLEPVFERIFGGWQAGAAEMASPAGFEPASPP